jgi:hypothetical protein
MLRVFADGIDFADVGIQKRLVGFSVEHCRESAAAADPEGAIGIFLNGVDVHLGLDPIGLKRIEAVCAIKISERAGIEAEPKSAARAGPEAIDALAVPAGAIGDGKVSEIDGIESHEAVLGSHPEVAVGGLGDGADPVEGQAVLTVPGLDIVFEHAAGRVESKGVRQD